jgi:peptidyl-prolyl cis-trans isomerase D
MSVLENLRKGTDSAGTRLLIGVVVIAFIFWGYYRRTPRAEESSTYASVNGVAIKDSEYRMEYAQKRHQLGHDLSPEEEGQVIQDLIDKEALVQEARRLGITVSGDEVARYIRKMDIFKGDAGEFSEKVYEKFLKGNQMSHARFEDRVWRQLLLEKLYDFATLGVSVSDAEARSTFAEHQTQIELAVVRLPVTAFLEKITVSDADRDAYIQQNADKIKARYDAAYDLHYNLPKRYQLSEILLRTDVPGMDKAAVQAKAEQIRKDAEGGADFAELARTWSEDLTASNGGSLGKQAANQLDPAIVAAADAAGAGHIAAVADTSRGLAVVKVEGIEDAKVIPLSDAQNDIAVSLIREERAPAEVSAFATKLISAWQAAGAPPRELIDEIGVPVDSTGKFSLSETEIPRLGNIPEVKAMLPTAKAGAVLATPITVKGTTTVVGVTSVDAPDMAMYDSIAPLVKAQLLRVRREIFFEQWQADVVARSKVEQYIATNKSSSDQ